MTNTNPTKQASTRNWTTLGTGIFLLVLAAGMVLLATENFIAIGFAWFAFLIGLGLIMMGALNTRDQKKETSHSAAPRPMVRIRCTHCNSLNLETSLRCSNCGAKL